MASTPPSERFPGWYPDPWSDSDERFWNGTGWSDRTREGLGLADYLGPIEPVLQALLDCTPDSSDSAAGASFSERPSDVREWLDLPVLD